MVCLITLVACVDHCTLGWSGCAMVLGKLSSSAGASYNFDHGGGRDFILTLSILGWPLIGVFYYIPDFPHFNCCAHI